MASQPLFYKKAVPLSKENHSGYSISPIKDYSFTKNTNSIYIAGIEFIRASKEYPIVFAKGKDDNVFPVVILGIKHNQNLYIDKDGHWRAKYIPAYIRRYPFILAASDEKKDNFAVFVDESYPGFKKDPAGQQLFDADGKESEILKQSITFLKEYQGHVQITTLFTRNINELGLLEPMQANIQMKDGEKLAMKGFWGVNREKLKKLSADKYAELVTTDQMELIYAHLNSLDNIDVLYQRLS